MWKTTNRTKASLTDSLIWWQKETVNSINRHSCGFPLPPFFSLHDDRNLLAPFYELKMIEEATHTACAAIVRLHLLQLSNITLPQGDVGFSGTSLLCIFSQSKGQTWVTWPQCIISVKISMADGGVDLSILSTISLWYQDPELSEPSYLLLKGCRHL